MIALGQRVLIRCEHEVEVGEVVNLLPGIPGWTRVRILRVVNRKTRKERIRPGIAVKDVRTETLLTEAHA
jgi:hypothetical protein